jgi:PIN domain nuclease of toxin-antitoxin system
VRYLLDTHAWVWAQLQPDLLSPAAAALLCDRAAVACLSPLTLDEVALLAERGRITRDASMTAWAGVPVVW